MTIIQALIFSVVEGITEFLPISSTGHLILVGRLLSIPQSEFVKTFEIVIQLGAILSVISLYSQKLVKNQKLWLPIVLAFLPTGVIGLILYKFIKQYLLGSVDVVVWSLLIGGLVIIYFEKVFFRKHNHTITLEKLTPVKSLFIGISQSISMIPGISRSAATIFGGMFVGMSRKDAVEFSFLLAIPTMLAATLLDLVGSGFRFTGEEYFLIIVGFLGSFVSALLTVRWLTNFVQTNNFFLFGIYRIILALVFLFFVR